MKKIKIEDFSKEMDIMVNRFYKENFDATQRALITVAQEGAKILERQSPVGTGRFKSSWGVETKYPNVKFIHNKALAPNRIPLSNLIEHSRRHTPFIYSTIGRYRGELFRKFIEEYQKEIKRK